jgi:excisionase family DNA binding protein
MRLPIKLFADDRNARGRGVPRKVQPQCKLALSPTQSAAALGVHVSVVYEALRNRRLVARMYGTRRRIAVRDLLEWHDSLPEAPAPGAKND